jgi:hypothetical protein
MPCGRQWSWAFLSTLVLACLPALEKESGVEACDAPVEPAAVATPTDPPAGAYPPADRLPAASAGAVPEVPEALLTALSQSLPDRSDACAACLRGGCANTLARCAADPACNNFVQCRWGPGGDVSPAGEQRCGAMYGQSPEVAGSPTRSLSSCWANSCAEACRLGNDWSCLDRFELPAPDSRSQVSIAQTLQVGFGDAGLAGVLVHFCPMATDPESCASTYDAMACTSTAGVARVALPISTDDRPGWSGYRHAQRADLDVLLQNNLPVLLDRFMLQHVPSNADLSFLAPQFGSDLSLGNVIFQVFDCAHTGAEGAVVELVKASSEPPGSVVRIGYQTSSSGTELGSGPTLAAASGGGTIQDFRADGVASLRVTLQETGQIIAQPDVRIIPGRVTLLEIHPAPAR